MQSRRSKNGEYLVNASLNAQEPINDFTSLGHRGKDIHVKNTGNGTGPARRTSIHSSAGAPWGNLYTCRSWLDRRADGPFPEAARPPKLPPGCTVRRQKNTR